MTRPDIRGPVGFGMTVLGMVIVGGSRSVEWLFIGGILAIVGLLLWWVRA